MKYEIYNAWDSYYHFMQQNNENLGRMMSWDDDMNLENLTQHLNKCRESKHKPNWRTFLGLASNYAF